MAYSLNSILRPTAKSGERSRSTRKGKLAKEVVPGITPALADLPFPLDEDQAERDGAFSVVPYVKHESIGAALQRGGIDVKTPSKPTQAEIDAGIAAGIVRQYERAAEGIDAPRVIGVHVREAKGWGFADLRYSTTYHPLESIGMLSESLVKACAMTLESLASSFKADGMLTADAAKHHKAKSA